MMKSLLGGAVLGALAVATDANAALVTATYSGVMTYTSAEATGAPWGYDAWGNYVVGDAYNATIVYNTSAGTTVDYPGGEQAQDQRPGFATESFTVAGHTYYSAGSAISYYDRSPDLIEFNISYSPGDFGGQFFEAITIPGVTISPSLNDPLSLTTADFGPGTGGNVVLPGSDAGAPSGAIYGDYDIEKLDITVAAPEPPTWALTLMGFAAAGLLYSRNVRKAQI